MDRFTKRSAVIITVLSVIFVLLIPLGIYLENRFDAVNTQLVLQQAAEAANYSEMMGIRTAMKVGITVINVCKIIIGILMILLGCTIIKRNSPKKPKNETKEIETENTNN